MSCVHNAYDSLTIILLRFSLDSRQVSPEFSCHVSALTSVGRASTQRDLWLISVTEALGMDATSANSHSFNGFNGCLWMFIVPQNTSNI